MYVKAESIHVCTRRKRGRSSVGMYGYWYEYERKEIDLWYACGSGETYIDVFRGFAPGFFPPPVGYVSARTTTTYIGRAKF